MIIMHTLKGMEKLYAPFETCNVSQFAFTAFSRVAAGHKVHSSEAKVQ